MKVKIFYFVCFILTITSCDSTKDGKSYVDEGIFEIVGESSIKLDSMTGFFSYDIQYFSFEGRDVVATLNHFINRIQLYDFTTGRQVINFDYDLIGPEGVGEQPRAFFVHNRDSIFVFDSWIGRVTLINSYGKSIDRYNLAPNGMNDGFAVPQASTQRHMKFIGGKLYLAGLLLPWEGLELNENQFIEYDIRTKEVKYLVPRPDIYNQANWGNSVMFHLNYDYNSVLDEFIFSFNNYDHVVVANRENETIKSYPTPSNYFDTIVPYDDEFSYEWDQNKLDEYNFLSPRYWGVVYDQYNKVTYRFALRPNSKEKYREGVRNMQVSLIILDENYQKIGEFEVDREVYDSRMYFVSNEGLHIANKKKFSENEDSIIFDIFNFKK